MRKEQTIKNKVDQMRASQYARYHAHEIAALEWAMGFCPSIPKRVREVHKQYGKALPGEIIRTPS